LTRLRRNFQPKVRDILKLMPKGDKYDNRRTI